MSFDQEGTLKTAIASYNNNGESTKVKINGKTVYVKFNLKATKTNTLAEADQKTKADKYIGEDGKEHRFGNTVTAYDTPEQEYLDIGGSVSEEGKEKEALAVGDTRFINFRQKHINEQLAGKLKGMDIQRLMTGAWMHEIGHNLTLLHGDKGIMGKPTVNPPTNGSDRNTYDYTDKLTKSNIESLLMRVNLPMYSLPEKDEDGEGTSGRIYKEK